ncbi:MAG: hypothetical protein PHW08_15500 [Kiritimatiellae bacterium]|nr:hypothetical protein [Kiritimatiellia bacterium]
MNTKMHFTPDDWARIERDWGAFWAGELDRPIVILDTCNLPQDKNLPDAPFFTAQLPLDMSADDVVDRYETRFPYMRWYGDAYPRWFVNFGPGTAAAFLGANMGVAPDTVWFEPSEIRELKDIHLRYDPDNALYGHVLDISRRAAERWKGQVCVSYPDLGGNLDILASLRTTERLLMDTMDCPDQIERLVGEITANWLKYFDAFHTATDTGCGHTAWMSQWSPGRTYVLQCDFSYMISPEMFRRFVLPDLTTCCRSLDHSFYHLDGKGALPHLDSLLEIEELDGIQWVPGAGNPEPAHWPEVLSRIRQAGKVCMVFGPPNDMLKIVREHGGKGFMMHTGGLQNEEDIQDFLQQLQREGKR